MLCVSACCVSDSNPKRVLCGHVSALLLVGRAYVLYLTVTTVMTKGWTVTFEETEHVLAFAQVSRVHSPQRQLGAVSASVRVLATRPPTCGSRVVRLGVRT